MPKNHFHFFLHRLIIRRNRYGIFKVGTCTVLYFYRYTEYCHCVGKYPLLPSAKVRKLPTTPSDAVVSPTPGPASTPTDAVALSTLGQASTLTDTVTLSTLGRVTCPTDAVALSTVSSNHPNWCGGSAQTRSIILKPAAQIWPEVNQLISHLFCPWSNSYFF